MQCNATPNAMQRNLVPMQRTVRLSIAMQVRQQNTSATTKHKGTSLVIINIVAVGLASAESFIKICSHCRHHCYFCHRYHFCHHYHFCRHHYHCIVVIHGCHHCQNAHCCNRCHHYQWQCLLSCAVQCPIVVMVVIIFIIVFVIIVVIVINIIDRICSVVLSSVPQLFFRLSGKESLLSWVSPLSWSSYQQLVTSD